jgi:leader peptidase (prepilin peptidase)/N-methyltransferase
MEIFYHNPWLFPLLATVVGAIISSFLNVVIYRLPKMMENSWKQELLEAFPDSNLSSAPTDHLNLSLPHSFCPHCQHKIRPWHNIPILGWLWLRGKCHDCHHPISIRYPLVELIGALLSGAIAFHFGLSGYALALMLFSYVLIAAAFIDLDTMLLPDALTLPLMWAGIVLAMTQVAPLSLHDSVLGAVLGYLSLWSLYWAFRLLTGKDGLGYGDFKLLAALGAWLGWQALPMIIFVSSLIGVFFGVAMLLIKGKNFQNTFPFGPFLALAGGAVLLWKYDILSYYLF